MNRLSLCQLTVETGEPLGDSLGASMLRTIEVAAAAGFTAVVPRVRHAPGFTPRPGHREPPIPVQEVRRRLADAGLEVASVMSFWITPEADAAEFEPAVDTAAAIGSQSIQAVCHDPDMARAQANFGQLCAMAAARGLRVALEFMPYSSVRSLADATRFIAGSGQRNAALCIDALHFHRSASSIEELGKLEPAAVGLVQLCDAPRAAPAPDRLRAEARGGRLYPGDGELPLEEFFEALPADCLLDIEAPCAAEAALAPEQKAKNAAAAMRRFLARHQSRAGREARQCT
jgi:sugar phosphate isomerase/epimerase